MSLGREDSTCELVSFPVMSSMLDVSSRRCALWLAWGAAAPAAVVAVAAIVAGVAVAACDSDDDGQALGVAGAAAAGGGGAGGGVGGASGGGGSGGGSGELCNGVDDDGDQLIDEGLEDFCGPCGRAYDLDVAVSYPIHGTWMFSRGDGCEWQQTLEAFHRQGGKSVWQFGPHFGVHSAAELRNHAELAACEQGGAHCVDAALTDLTAQSASNTVATWLTYEFRESYSDVILACPALDRKITVGDRTYWRIVLPHQSGQSPCSFDGGSYDVLFTWFEQADSPSLLLSVADGLEMDVYLGMPGAPPLAGQPWNVDTSLRPAFIEWSRRVLADYAARHASHPSFAGVYQTFEVQLQPTGLDAIYATYGMIADAVKAALPGKAYALSPYWDVNRAQGNQSAALVKEGFKRLAREGVGLARRRIELNCMLRRQAHGTARTRHYRNGGSRRRRLGDA